MRFSVTTTFLVMIGSAIASQAATVTLENGTTREGRVIVRGDIVTIVAPTQRGTKRLFQYPLNHVVRIQGDKENPNIVSLRTVLRKSNAKSSEPLEEFEKGLEIKRIALRGDWLQVEAWNEKTRGFIPVTALASEVQFTPEEKQAAKKHLNQVDPPPPSLTGEGQTTQTSPQVIPTGTPAITKTPKAELTLLLAATAELLLECSI